MLNLYPRMSANSTDGDGDGDYAVVNAYRVFYAISVVCVSIFIFCALVGSSSIAVWQACAVATLAALLLGVIGYLAPKTCVRGRGRPASALLALTATPGRVRAPGCACVLPANVPLPPAFAYVGPLESDGGGNQEATARCVMCPVCLEDVQGGEMVRQLECRHIFHVECVDMWLQSHRTCPVCRYVIKLPVMLTLKAAATEDVPESSNESLPPV